MMALPFFLLTLPLFALAAGSADQVFPSRPDDASLLPYERYIVAHAIVCVIGFMVCLPAGALLARYLRTFSPSWYTGHWIIQFAVAGPIIVIGIILGHVSSSKIEAVDANYKGTDHKSHGTAIFVLYLAQCALGAIIHYIKPKNRTRRPPQNYIHAIFGLLVICLSIFQIHNGYNTEWPRATGRGNVSSGVSVIFYIWVAILPISYFAGLAFLPKQLRQENASKPSTLPGSYNTLNGASHVEMNPFRDN